MAEAFDQERAAVVITFALLLLGLALTPVLIGVVNLVIPNLSPAQAQIMSLIPLMWIIALIFAIVTELIWYKVKS